MARQTVRKGMRRGQLRNKTADERCKEFEFNSFSVRQYWIACSGGLISVALGLEHHPVVTFKDIHVVGPWHIQNVNSYGAGDIERTSRQRPEWLREGQYVRSAFW